LYGHLFADIDLLLVTPSTPFDLVRYIDKLLTPSVHAARLRKTVRNHVFQKIIRLPLDVICVPTNPAPSNPLNLPSDQEIRSFLAYCYGEYAPDEPIVSEVLERTSTEVLRKIRLRSTLDIKPPHCECILVHYHLSLQNSGPYPNIAVSKLSCLPCGLAACRKYGEQKGNAGEEGRDCESLISFQTRGCHAEVTPLLALPTGPTTADLDAFVEEDILNAVKVVLRSSVHKERMRRLPQSTAGSDGSSPDDATSFDGKIFLYRDKYNLINACFRLQISQGSESCKDRPDTIVGHPFRKRVLEASTIGTVAAPHVLEVDAPSA
jgi:hypothetical protein